MLSLLRIDGIRALNSVRDTGAAAARRQLQFGGSEHNDDPSGKDEFARGKADAIHESASNM